jgi:hypothetical protein
MTTSQIERESISGPPKANLELHKRSMRGAISLLVPLQRDPLPAQEELNNSRSRSSMTT